MYQFIVNPGTRQSVLAAVDQYNALVSGRKGVFGAGAHASATLELGQLWDAITPEDAPKQALSFDLSGECVLSKSQIAGLIRALEVAVFVGDGRYCSALEHLGPVVDRHPNAYLLRLGFVWAEKCFIELGLEKAVDGDFRKLASGLREAFAYQNGSQINIEQIDVPGVTIRKVIPQEDLVAAC